MKPRSKLKLVLAILLMAAAVGLSLRHFFSDKSVPDLEDTKTVWHCAECDQGFALDRGQFSAMVTKRPDENRESDDNRPTPRRAGGRFVEIAQCPVCNKQSGVKARRCHDCDAIFQLLTETGAIATCPKCSWDPVAKGKQNRRGADP